MAPLARAAVLELEWVGVRPGSLILVEVELAASALEVPLFVEEGLEGHALAAVRVGCGDLRGLLVGRVRHLARLHHTERALAS